MASNIQIKRKPITNSTVPPPNPPPPPPCNMLTSTTTSTSAVSAPPSASSGSVADDLERLFIAVIRRHPVLYSRTHPQSQPSVHPAAHAGAWRQVAQEMRLEVGSCKSLWSCIKQKYIKYRKRREATTAVGDAAVAAKDKEWPLYEAMHDWLDANIQRRRSRLEMFKSMCNNQQGWQPATEASAAEGEDEAAAEQELLDAAATVVVAADSVDSADWRELPDPTKPAGEVDSDAEEERIVVIARKTADRSTVYHQRLATAGTNPVIVAGTAATLKRTLSSATSSAAAGFTVQQPASKMQRCMKIEIVQPAAEVRPQSETSDEKAEPVAAAALETTTTSSLELSRLQQTFGKCIDMLEQSLNRQRQSDPDEVFGRLIASMVREIPAERRRAARVELLQLAGDVLINFS